MKVKPWWLLGEQDGEEASQRQLVLLHYVSSNERHWWERKWLADLLVAPFVKRTKQIWQAVGMVW